MLEFPNVKHPRIEIWGEISRVYWGEINTCARARVDQLLVLGMVIQPLIGNPYNGYLGAPAIGLMSLSPTIGKQWEFRPWLT